LQVTFALISFIAGSAVVVVVENRLFLLFLVDMSIPGHSPLAWWFVIYAMRVLS